MKHRSATLQTVRLFALGAITLALPVLTMGAQSAGAVPAAAAVKVQAVLASKVNSKSAKVGDTVKAKTVGRCEFNGRSIPNGSVLTGTVTSVIHNPATLGLAFTSLAVKHQDTVQIQGELVAIAPAPSDADPNFQIPVRGGYTQAAPINQTHTNSDDDSKPITGTGSTVRELTLDGGTLRSGGDIRLERERLVVALTPAAK